MNTNKNIRLMTQTALLIAFAIMIPLYFGFLKIMLLDGFTATIASHVPIFLSMFLGPFAAVMVGIGSTIGFQMAGMPPQVVARAAMHIFIGLAGAYMLKKNVSFIKVAIITAPLHGLLEAVAIIPFMGVTINNTIVLIGTMIHHTVDAVLSYGFAKALWSSGQKQFAVKSEKIA